MMPAKILKKRKRKREKKTSEVNTKIPKKSNENKPPINDEESSEEESITDSQDASIKYKSVPIVINTDDMNDTIIKNILSHEQIQKLQATIKYSRKTLKIYPVSEEASKAILNELTAESIPFHTFASSSELDKKFVIKGLPNLNIDIITNYFVAQEINPKYISMMKSKTDIPREYPVYFMAMDNTTDPALIYNIKTLHYYRIKIEKYVNKRVGTQCYNCQGFGHGSAKCFNKPKCVKCGLEHLTKDCEKSKDTDATCANCKQAHPANFTGCEVYQRYLQTIQLKRQRQLQGAKPTQAPPKIQSRELYPSLPQTSAIPGFTPGPQNNINSTTRIDRSYNNVVNTNHSSVNVNSYSNPVETENCKVVADLITELKTLNSFVNIKTFLINIRVLNQTLRSNPNKAAQCDALIQFAVSIGYEDE